MLVSYFSDLVKFYYTALLFLLITREDPISKQLIALVLQAWSSYTFVSCTDYFAGKKANVMHSIRRAEENENGKKKDLKKALGWHYKMYDIAKPKYYHLSHS